MAERDIIQNLIARLGQSQADRLPRELQAGFVDIDERNAADLMSQGARLANLLQFYRDDPQTPAGTWRSLFPDESELAGIVDRDDGGLPPHLGLFASLIALYRIPQQALNTITARHLELQYRRVLGFEPRTAVPDRCHVLVELKKGAAATPIDVTHEFSAGKDARGVEVVYRPVRRTTLTTGRVARLCSVFRDAAGVFFAPIANSRDGLGEAFEPGSPGWPPFGGRSFPPAQIGFALASPVLRMAEGNRTVRVELDVAGVDPVRHSASFWAETFDAHLSGPKGWIGPLSLSATISGSRVTLQCVATTSQAAVVDYSPAVHGQQFAAASPVLQILLKPAAQMRYAELETLTVGKGRLTVAVQGVKALTLQGDSGSLNPKRPFQPFGTQPVAGSRFQVGCAEAFSKRLRDFSLQLTWRDAPVSLVDWYRDYSRGSLLKNGVSADLVYQDRNGQVRSTVVDIMARDSLGISTLTPHSPPPSVVRFDNEVDSRVFALMSGGSLALQSAARRVSLSRPNSTRTVVPPPGVRAGFLTIALREDFLHADYRRETVRNALNQSKIVLNEPYTPTVQSISLDYEAESEDVDFSADDQASFGSLDLQFFHVGCFGQRREHAYLRRRVAFLADRSVPLMPEYPHAGELLIGLAGVGPGDDVSLLFQVVAGSSDPEVVPPTLSWWVMSDNYWRRLTPLESPLDATDSLKTSGIVALALPRETTVEQTFVPGGLVWLRATVPAGSRGVCHLVQVANNAVEVEFVDRDNDPARLSGALPAGSIARLKTAAATVKGVTQPFAGFGGRLEESLASLTRRAAERLRHRQRCVTGWDCERMVLEEFPEVYRVKCVPHASLESWLAPGHLLLIVVPDLRNGHAVDRLRPRVDVGTLARIARFVERHCGMQVQVHLKNPRYQRVRLKFQVRFHPGRSYALSSRDLHEALVRVLSPWMDGAAARLEFGGEIYRSRLLQFVEEQPDVDYVTEFLMFSPDSSTPWRDLSVVQAETPDAILVSDSTHEIAEAPVP